MKIGTDQLELFVEVEKHSINGQDLEVVLVPLKWWLGDSREYGAAFCDAGVAHVRSELPKFLRRFVTYHELYHLIDPYTWGDWWGAEIRANLVAGICCPLGLLHFTWATITSAERRAFYRERFRGGF